jgi:hypothetical protein
LLLAHPSTNFGFTGFTYNNVPAFSLHPGDTIAFDLSDTNDISICRTIYMAVPLATLPACSRSTFRLKSNWTLVAALQCPTVGKVTAAGFDLQFYVTSPFTFAGGQLILGFSSRGAPVDTTCDQVLVSATCNDGSASFINRFYFHLELPTTISSAFIDTQYLTGFRIQCKTWRAVCS